MQNFDFTLSFIVPMSHKIIPLTILYGQQIIYEHLVMPWETGISKKITFSTQLNTQNIQISQLKLINNLNKMPITLEILELNNEIQNISEYTTDNQSKIYLDTFLKDCYLQATIFKIINLPSTISVSHSYLCNGNLYVPQCDRHNSIISFNNQETDKFNFNIELFATNMTECLCHIECVYDNGKVINSLERGYQKNINQLHQDLKNHYEEICFEEFISDTPIVLNNAHPILTFPTTEKILSIDAAYQQDISVYSVIKIEGLPKNIDIQKHDIFYQNGIYYIADNQKAYHYLLSQAFSDTDIHESFLISYYHHNTFEPVLQNRIYNANHIYKVQKTG
jgi:hypothetical protein